MTFVGREEDRTPDIQLGKRSEGVDSSLENKPVANAPIDSVAPVVAIARPAPLGDPALNQLVAQWHKLPEAMKQTLQILIQAGSKQ